MINPNPETLTGTGFLGLFGAGGMWSAIVFTGRYCAAGFLVLFAVAPDMLQLQPLSGLLPGLYRQSVPAADDYPASLWGALHRIHHCMHDLKIHILPAGRWVFYGLATIPV